MTLTPSLLLAPIFGKLFTYTHMHILTNIGLLQVNTYRSHDSHVISFVNKMPQLAIYWGKNVNANRQEHFQYFMQKEAIESVCVCVLWCACGNANSMCVYVNAHVCVC